jgi:septal ring factor EnvC (AmiA/AmiB activator)
MALLVALSVSACLPSKQDVDTAQAIIEIGDAINDIRTSQAELQSQIDSLRFEVAKRDTVIRQLANLAGVAIPP